LLRPQPPDAAAPAAGTTPITIGFGKFNIERNAVVGRALVAGIFGNQVENRRVLSIAFELEVDRKRVLFATAQVARASTIDKVARLHRAIPIAAVRLQACP